jgi:hypothetical protein
MGARLDVVTARDLAGTYTGVLQGVTVANLADIDDPQRQVIVDLDLLHKVTVRAAGDLTLRFESSIIPPLRATVLGVGSVAINAAFLDFEGLNDSGGGLHFDLVKVKQIVFVQHEGEWIVVLQLVRVGVAEQESVDDVYVYQYVSYPSRVAERMSREEAIRYVNAILRLASDLQRR